MEDDRLSNLTILSIERIKFDLDKIVTGFAGLGDNRMVALV